MFDILGALGALIVLGPLLVIVTVLVLTTDGRPILYRQQRVGRKGKPFRILKFRTMSLENSGPPITVLRDGRITPLGSRLRKYKLDELPQLVNVLRGEMSLIGPRPEVPEYVKPDDHFGRTNPVQLDHGLYLHGSNMTVVNNVFYNIVHGWSIQGADGLDHAVIAHNTFAFKNAVGNVGQIMLWDRQSNLTIQNNIFYGGEQYAIVRYHAFITSCAIDHNVVYGASGIISNGGGCVIGPNQIGVDPLFANANSDPYDFHLRAGSPAAHAGASSAVKHDFDGQVRTAGASDVGAFAMRGAVD